jgi:hypothetical protein
MLVSRGAMFEGGRGDAAARNRTGDQGDATVMLATRAMVGHDDGGFLIATVYSELAQRRAIARAQRAMDAYKQCQAAASKLRHLRVVS